MSTRISITAAGTEKQEPLLTGKDVRLAARANVHANPTPGFAPGYIQANLIVLPLRYASDFRQICTRNPVPCPLLAESAAPGCCDRLKSHLPGLDADRLASNLDIRRDAPRYNVYTNAKLSQGGCTYITAEWTADHVAFLIGCSFSFEAALAAAGLPPPHTLRARNVPMYRTTRPLWPAGVFTGATCVVSMRIYPAGAVERVRDITRAYGATHGEPIDWGWGAPGRLGIADIRRPDWGDGPLGSEGKALGEEEGEVPVFWGCGVTPQEAVMRAGLEGVVMAHAPGHMLVWDLQDEDVVPGSD